MAFLLIALFIVVPIAELYVIIQVGEAIGIWPTLLLLLLDAVLGSLLLRHQGRGAWRRFNEALAQRRFPGKEVADGLLIVVGGTLLLTPGFVTDIAGFFFVLPMTRPIARRLLLAYLGRRAVVTVSRYGPMPGGPAGNGMSGGRVVPGEVVRDPPETGGEPRGDDRGEGPDSRGPGRITGGR